LLSAGERLSTSTQGGFGVDVQAVFFAFAAFSYSENMLAPFFIYVTRIQCKKIRKRNLKFLL
jgi:hypothetical protein